MAKPVDLRTVRVFSKDDLPPGFMVDTDRLGKWKRFKPSILRIYILKEILSPFLVALSFFTMIYMAVAIQKMIGLFVGKGVDFFRLLDYMGYVFGNTLPMTIPMACLMSGIMAAGRLSGDSEITAMRASGVSFPYIYSNFLVFGFLMTLIVGYLNFYLGPENTRKMKDFDNWIATYNPLLAIQPGQFSGDKTQDFFSEKGRTMYSGGIDADGNLSNVQIREWAISADGTDFIMVNNLAVPMGGSRMLQIINAKEGYLVEKKNLTGEYEKSVRLRKGYVIEWDPETSAIGITNFMDGEMDYNTPAKKETKTLSINVKPDTFSLPMLIEIRNAIESEGLEKIPGLEILKEYGLSIKGVGGLKQMVEQFKYELIMGASSGKQEDMAQKFALFTQLSELLNESKKTLTGFNVEIHKRFATPLSCQIFFFLSFPLGLVVKRSGKGMSFTLAVIFLLIYYTFFIFGSGISYKENVPDWVGPWSANIVIATLSIYIMISRTDAKLPESIRSRLGFYFRFRDLLEEKVELVKNRFRKAK
ncbi:LptF/LptG family permease [Leptospira sp. 201903075]|uniref:LptF/LptG family permease n=1 Tax=Leptospira chreensis TaxID=2810035 RepID=UPI0019629937|nr:LptF/LptG family permease [Leptospira chreensis]MBM9589326.1 LptF/LptG family permease [Leptospira chreensis]